MAAVGGVASRLDECTEEAGGRPSTTAPESLPTASSSWSSGSGSGQHKWGRGVAAITQGERAETMREAVSEWNDVAR